MIFKASSNEELESAFIRAKGRDLAIGIYPKRLFDTKSGEENVSLIAKLHDDDLDLVGFIVYGENKKVNKALEGLKFHD